MTPRRYELSDFEWSIIEPLLPNKPRGVARSDDRKVLNGGCAPDVAARVCLGGRGRTMPQGQYMHEAARRPGGG